MSLRPRVVNDIRRIDIRLFASEQCFLRTRCMIANVYVVLEEKRVPTSQRRSVAADFHSQYPNVVNVSRLEMKFFSLFTEDSSNAHSYKVLTQYNRCHFGISTKRTKRYFVFR